METKQITTPVMPVAIAKKSPGVENAEFLLEKRDFALSLHDMHVNNYGCRLHQNDYLILDFGMEYAGGLRLIVSQVQGGEGYGKIRIRFGESLGEASSEIGEKGQVRAHAPRDFKAEVLSLSDSAFGHSGFRYARIDNLGTETIIFQQILLNYESIDAKQIGYFRSDDELLNKIYDYSVRSAFMCCQNSFLYDGIKRDRLIWSGDMGVEIKTLLENYGDIDNIRNSLSFCRDHYPLPDWINGIPSYSIWWIINLSQHYRYTLDKGYLLESFPYLDGVLSLIESHLTTNGELDFNPEEKEDDVAYFIDWPTCRKEGVKEAVTALVKMSLEEASYLFEELGEKTNKAKLILAKLKKPNINLAASKGLLAVYQLAYQNDFSKELKRNGISELSTFMSYHILKAMAQVNDYETSIKVLKEYYGDMVRMGATTFFEDYQPEWGRDLPITSEEKPHQRYMHADNGRYCYVGYRMSLCHGWASGPAPFLLEEIAGIKQLSGNEYEIKPHLCGLKNVEAALSTKYGPIAISIKDGKLLSVKAPKEIIIKK